MWLSRPVYELLPYLYMVMGVLFLGSASFASNQLTNLLLLLGVILLILGAVLWLRRRDYRRGQSEYNSRSLDD